MSDEPRCGTRYKFIKHNCRCDECVAAAKEFNRKKIAKKQALPKFPAEPIIAKMNDYQRAAHEHFVRTGPGKMIPIYQADRLCCEIGVHPYEVYGDSWYEDIWQQMATSTRKSTW